MTDNVFRHFSICLLVCSYETEGNKRTEERQEKDKKMKIKMEKNGNEERNVKRESNEGYK